MRILFYLDAGETARFAREAERHGHRVVRKIKKFRELDAELQASTADVLLISANPDRLQSTILSACDYAGVRVIGFSSGPADRRNAMSLGLREVLDSDTSWSQVEEFLMPISLRASAFESQNDQATPASDEKAEVSESDGGRGTIIAVWGPAGAPGRTTVAISLAAELAAAGATVALLDADTHSGSVAPSLGLLDEAPGLAAACRLVGQGSLNAAELDRIAEHYRSAKGSFRVLTGLGRPHRWPELSSDRVSRVIEETELWVDFTVIDTGFSFEQDEEISSDFSAPRRNAATIAALESADRIVAVGSGDPIGLSRFLRAHVDLVETFGMDRILTVINKIRSSVVGANPFGQVERTLLRFGAIREATMVPFDLAALDAATLSGRTLLDVAPRSQARQALASLAQQFLQARISRRAG